MSNATQRNITAGTVTRLRRRLQRHGITNIQIAREAGLSRYHVCHVLAGRNTSARVIATAKRLIAERQAQAENGSAA